MEITSLTKEELEELYSSFREGHDFVKAIYRTPSDAHRGIRNYYGTDLDISGTSVKDIAVIRDTLFQCVPIADFLNAFVIVLPHTHWDGVRPVIYNRPTQGGEYIIGHHPLQRQKYYPVSFAFSSLGLIPYEWVDDSVDMNPAQWAEAIKILQRFFEKLPDKNMPFGLCIDFRFKTRLFDPSLQTVELTIDNQEEPWFGFSRIVRRDSIKDPEEALGLEQVAWNPQSDLLLDLSNDEMELLNSIRVNLRERQADSMEMIQQIESSMGKLDVERDA